MTEITRNVILDLLPLYIADEVSADTKELVKNYLETDPELAKIAEQSASIELPDDAPFPMTKEDKMEAYKEAKKYMVIRTIVLTITLSATFVCVLLIALLAAGYFIP
jgi:hypothetical protein